MKNQEIAKILYEIADLLEIEGVEFKPRAYRRAAQNIESLSVDIEELYKKGQLDKIPGVGKSIAEKIKEYLETGKVRKLEELRKKIPVDIESLSAVEGLGPRMIKTLYEKLGVKNLDDLERVCKERRLRRLKGFGEKLERKILENIQLVKQRQQQRFLLGFVLPEANAIVEELKPYVKKISLAGSIRRRKETIGDVDILAVADEPEYVMDLFTGMKRVEKVLAKGKTKSSVRLYGGIQVDLRIVEEESFGSALQYFTGSKEHNIEVRKIAIKHGYKLNEYGLFKGEKKIAGKDEEEVYKALGMQWIPPELRENRGEIEAALNGSLPKLVEYEDVKGDLQMHTKWSDGANTIEEMVQEAKKLGHKFIAITDHVGSLKIAGGMDEEDVKEQAKEIEKIREKYDDIYIFHGVEANIMKDGSLDVSNSLLKEVDLVLASVHSAFRMDEKEMTKRVIKAIEHEYVDIIAHPTCRIIQKREPIKLDIEKVFEAAKENDVIMEINAYPDRLDLNDIHTKMAIEMGIKISIGTDAHSKEHLKFYELGVAVARRGWAEKKDIINTYSIEELRKLFQK
ncbi:MAG TPA: DNA polymerase/3'-5' exonuclease PolX [Thermoplasmatales archaeon]|nr:DNA polymerase/3'-5' exonuclease PolX [Thermoplasmatales archaeon]